MSEAHFTISFDDLDPKSTISLFTYAEHSDLEAPEDSNLESFTKDENETSSKNPPNATKLKLLGEGGMGAVYLAKQALPERHVAIKELKRKTPKLEQMLLEEAMLTGKLSHPNIIPIYQLSQGEHGLEVIMQKVDGLSLKEHLGGAPQKGDNLREAIQILLSVCHALEYAHTKNIIHRDIKPENIMFGHFGEVYLLDWGISIELTEQTQSKTVLVGTPAYMAPEMLSGKVSDVDVQTDIYLLGSTLYEICTGTTLHTGSNLDEIFEEVRTSSPKNYPPDVFSELAELGNQACHVDRSQRPKTVSEFREKLENCITHWDAYKLSLKAQIDLEILQESLKQEHQNMDSEQGPFQSYIRARIGFEQALELWESCTEAQEGIVKAIHLMLKHTITTKQVSLAKNLVLDFIKATPEHPERSALEEQVALIAQEETKRNQLAAEHDLSISQGARKLIVVINCLATGSVTAYAIYSFSQEGISTQSLLRDCVGANILAVILFLYFRKTLTKNAIGRRVSTTIFILIWGITLNRLIGHLHGHDPLAVITVDDFILAMAYANSQPAITHGFKVAICGAVVGLVSLLAPITAIPLHILLVVASTAYLAWDWFDS
ncbi:MAG: hypothetical protein CMK59_09720 [Proteobacteria bacterium]|nr:hypothetical protein [Pseudomonadota bacterium]